MIKKNWLYNRTVVITGASSGIGRDITRILIKKYCCKVIGIARSGEKMVKLANEFENRNNFSYKLFDVSILENWLDFKDYLCKDNIQIDILINCAGKLPPFKCFNDYTLDEIQDVMNVNYFSVIFAIKTLLPILEKSAHASIINISSSASLCSIAGTSIYSASKSALKALTECMTAEYKRKIYVSLVCPGFTKTDIFRNQKYKDERKIINLISSSSKKIANKIVCGMKKHKKRLVLGNDAKLMNNFYRLMPKTSIKIINRVIRKSKVKLFTDVYHFDKH